MSPFRIIGDLRWWRLGGVQMVLGTLAAQIFVARTAFLVSLVGAVLFLGGTRTLKILAFPLFLLTFMFPIPAIIYARMTLPLQLFASSVAETILSLIGVAGAARRQCSGIGQPAAFGGGGLQRNPVAGFARFLSLVYAYFFDRKAWMRWVLLAATIPIAIAANAARVTLMGLISEYRPDLAQGFFHTARRLGVVHRGAWSCWWYSINW